MADPSVESIVQFISYAGVLYLLKTAFFLILEIRQAILGHIRPYFSPTDNLTSKYGQWAVVTGASDVVLQHYARELAKKRLNIVLISRRLKDIEPTAQLIEKESRVKTKCIAVDFREGTQVYDAIKRDLTGLDIGILVNANDNRLQKKGKFLDTSVPEIWECVDNNLTSVAMMTSIVLPAMTKKKRGKIVNYSSMLALEPQANTTGIDSASKAFTLYLSLATKEELKCYNIEVQTLCPATALSRPDNRFLFNYPTPEVWAKSAVDTIDRVACTTGHWSHGVLAFLSEYLPTSWWETIVESGSRDFPKNKNL